MKTCLLVMLTGLCGSLLQADDNTQCPQPSGTPCVVSISVLPSGTNVHELTVTTNSYTPANPDITVDPGVNVQWNIKGAAGTTIGGDFYVLFLPGNKKVLKKMFYHAAAGTPIMDKVTYSNITSEYLIFWKYGTQVGYFDPKVKSNNGLVE